MLPHGWICEIDPEQDAGSMLNFKSYVILRCLGPRKERKREPVVSGPRIWKKNGPLVYVRDVCYSETAERS